MIEEVWNWLSGVKQKPKEEEFMSADEAYRKSLGLKEKSREDFKKALIKNIQRSIKDGVIRYNNEMCFVSTYSSSREKDVLPEVAEYFVGKGYDVDLKNGEHYPDTNILIINWQNREIFQG